MNSASVLTEVVVLTQVNKGVGVLIALVGAAVAAPAGWREIVRTSGVWMRAQFSRFRKVDPPPLQVSAGGFSSSLGSVTMTAAGRVWDPQSPVDDRLADLRKHVLDVERRLNDSINALADEKAARGHVVDELGRALHARLDEFERRIEEKDRWAAQVDARGLPVIGFGVLLSGIPEWIAELPLYVGWVFPFAGFGLMIKAVVESRIAHVSNAPERGDRGPR